MTYEELKVELAALPGAAKLTDAEAAAALQGRCSELGWPAISAGDVGWARAVDSDGQHPDQKRRQAAAEKRDADWVAARDAAKAAGNLTIDRADFEAGRVVAR